MSWDKESKRWRVSIRHNGKNNNRGRFDDEHEAAKAFDAAARRLRPNGEAHGGRSGNTWLWLNFPTVEEETYAVQQGMSAALKKAEVMEVVAPLVTAKRAYTQAETMVMHHFDVISKLPPSKQAQFLSVSGMKRVPPPHLDIQPKSDIFLVFSAKQATANAPAQLDSSEAGKCTRLPNLQHQPLTARGFSDRLLLMYAGAASTDSDDADQAAGKRQKTWRYAGAHSFCISAGTSERRGAGTKLAVRKVVGEGGELEVEPSSRRSRSRFRSHQ